MREGHTMANQQTPERVTSDPVPVPPPTDEDRDRDGVVDEDRDRDGVDEHDRNGVVDDRDRDDARRDAAEDVTDRVPEDAIDDRGTFEDPVLTGERNDPDDLTAVDTRSSHFDEPAPQETAFGAATVGGAVAAAAQAGPSREVRDTDPGAEGAVDDRDFGTDPDAVRDGRDDRDTDTTRDDLRGDTTALDADRAAEERAYQDTAERPVDGAADLPEIAPAVDTPAAPSAAPAVEEPVAGLWGEGTAQGYRDRWREVQLRFIDDPAGAAREANQLVEEAVGALTAELSRQKESLSGWSGEDTEELRSVVRRHRDFLDRLLGL
ncbi:hypothetical protein ACTMTJ_23635 [Phytohabitans sp. LJ34]|uniref:hypothetical protein n=1 Tax=Phytohabitans sp. LJ34 TaxID=3452217 RepID=UPI003F8BDFC6